MEWQTMFNEWEWERAVVLELQREHAHVQRLYKVKLRSVTIRLDDFAGRWGSYDHLSRTISLARRLVREHKWDKVIGIFRHEVAHQLVAEEARGDFLKPHGLAFREACRRLGLTPEYARAGIDVEAAPPDWRLEERTPDEERILDRVRKLLALATSGNEHEALLAMARVREIYGKYNLEQAELGGEQGFVHLIIDEGKKRLAAWEHAKLALLGEHFFVRVITFAQFQPATGTNAQAIEIIGRRENVLMAEYVYYFLRRQVDLLLQQAVAARGLARRERGSFRLGVLHGFSTKLRASEKAAEPTVVSRALTRFRGDPKIDAYIGSIHPRLVSSRRGPVRVESDAYAQGRQAGHRITLQKPVESQRGSGGAGHRLTGKL